MRCKTKQEEDSRSVDLRVSSHHDDAQVVRPPGRFTEAGVWKINDRRLEEIRETEFGLPPSNYEGRFGNGAPFAFLQSAQKRSSRKPPNPLRSARGAATFCAASPRTQAAARGDSRGSGDSRRLSARAALWHAHASNSPPQRRRRR